MSLSLFLPPRAIVMTRKGLAGDVLATGTLEAAPDFEAAVPGPSLVFFGDIQTQPEDTLLTRMLEAMGLKRSETVVCRTIGELTAHASPSLKIVVALGKPAAQLLVLEKFQGAEVMPTLHPSELLRSPELKREAWNDLLKVAAQLGMQIPKKGS
jgi:hypothetical protein